MYKMLVSSFVDRTTRFNSDGKISSKQLNIEEVFRSGVVLAIDPRLGSVSY